MKPLPFQNGGQNRENSYMTGEHENNYIVEKNVKKYSV